MNSYQNMRLLPVSPQRPNRASGNAAGEGGAHGCVHVGAEGGFDCDFEAAVAEGEAGLHMLCCCDADAASAVDAFARLVHQSADKALTDHIFTRTGPILVAVDFVVVRIRAQGAGELLSAVALQAAGSGGDSSSWEGVHLACNFRYVGM